MTTPTLDDMIACARREIRAREAKYPAWLAAHTITPQTAEHELACMRGLLALAERERARQAPQPFNHEGQAA